MGIFDSAYSSFISFASTFIPNFVIPNLQLIIQVVIILIAGYVTGRVVKVVTVKVLNVVGLKRITSKSWAESILKAAGYRGSIVELISDLVKWLVYILFFALIIQTLGLAEVAFVFTSVAAFIPRFIGAILIIAIGFIIADFFGKIFEEATRSLLSEDMLSALAGGLVKYSVSLIAIIMALSLIGLDVISVTILFTMVLVGIMLTIFLGIKDIFPNYIAGLQLRKMLKPGETVKVGSHSGVVEKIEPLALVLRNGSRQLNIPHSFVLKHIIEKRAK